MKRRSFLLVVLLLSAMAALTPLAYASPPDPAWIKGLYDDDDFDNVVVIVTSGVSAVAFQPLWDAAPSQVAVASATPADESAVSTPALWSPQTRAPPAS